MFPHTRALADSIRRGGNVPIGGHPDPEYLRVSDAELMDNPQFSASYEMRLKRRLLNKRIKDMLERAGYDELARMVNFRHQ